MKATCLQENIKRALSIVMRAIAGRATLPVLSHVLIAASDNRLTLSATNLEIGITCSIGAKVEDGGAVTIPAKLLSDLITSLPNDAITLTLDERTQTIHVACARSEANIKGIEADEFPRIPHIDDDATTTMPADLLRTVIDQVAFAAAKDDTRPVMAGVLMKLTGAEATFTATDGFRLALKTIELPEPVHRPAEVIIPARALIALGQVLGDRDEPVSITIPPTGTQVLFRCDTIELVSRVIDGTYPGFERIIPKEYTSRAVLDRASFLRQVKQAAVFASVSANATKLTLDADHSVDGKVTLSANAAEVGDNRSEIDAQITGAGGQIALNNTFTRDALDAIDTPQVAFEMQTQNAPGVFRPVGDDTLLIVTMPMAINSQLV
jgi:DNA polymerase III subunit beta